MPTTTKKRTIGSFFANPAKKAKTEDPSQASTTLAHDIQNEQLEFSNHKSYPHPIANFPTFISSELASLPSTIGKVINDQPDLDLLYFQPYFPSYLQRQVFEFLRQELPFHRVEYDIHRGGIATHIKTPRYTTVFGLDSTSIFSPTGTIVSAETSQSIISDPKYISIPPRPLPSCLNALRQSTEAATGATFNFCLVNYYASGSDSISYHSDDEHFLGLQPTVASFSFGARRDFLMKHKPFAPKEGQMMPETKPVKLPLASGDMVVMRGRTQGCWLHSIPKRTGKNAEDGGRINITFRKALVKGGTENYYRYNVGTGPVFKWDEGAREMTLWKNQEVKVGK